MECPARMTLKPSLHFWMFMGCIIVYNGMDDFAGRNLSFDGIQEADELPMAVTLHIAADHATDGRRQAPPKNSDLGRQDWLAGKRSRRLDRSEGGGPQGLIFPRAFLWLKIIEAELVRRMISAVPQPAPVRSIMLARQTCFCGQLRSATIASRRARSEAVTSKAIPVRMERDSHSSRPKGIPNRPDSYVR